jgi:hypothetical protein
MNLQSSNSQLTVDMVEGIHAAVLSGKHHIVGAALAAVRDVTLPGLIEYLCLRYATSGSLQIPAVPESINQSVVGAALHEVPCPFGLRTHGRVRRRTTVNPEPAEFFVLHHEADFNTRAYKLFETRWARACEKLGLRQQSGVMHLAMSAMTENALLYAKTNPAVLVGYRLLDHAALFTVADLGQGVLASLRSNPEFQNLAHSRDALRMALHDGVSCLGRGKNGYGFRQVFKALANQFGTLRFRAGNACITMDGTQFDADLGTESYPERLPGFQVTVCCRRALPKPGDPADL